ncbi:MAG: acetoacetate decarboxylase [Bradyrhizobium sp.]|nr:acetoacetate decarboxylase [Bradyrhizobium sp.]
MNAADVTRDAFAMPLASPSYPPGPYRFVDREHLIVSYRTDIEAIEEAVPEPLEWAEPLVRLEFMRMAGGTGFGRYSGAAQTVPVSLNGQAGSYTHSMFLDVHAPISGGRELWGFPQKLAAPSLEVAHDVLIGALDYGHERVASASMGYKHASMEADLALAMLSEPGFLLKIIPHVDGTPRICELVRFFRRDIVVKGAWCAPASLELHPHALSRLDALPVRGVVSGVHILADFTLDLGEVVHDYLA